MQFFLKAIFLSANLLIGGYAKGKDLAKAFESTVKVLEQAKVTSGVNFIGLYQSDASNVLNGMTFLHPDHQAPKNCSIVVKIEYNKNKLPPFGGMDNKILGSEKVPGSEGFLFVVNFLPTLNCV